MAPTQWSSTVTGGSGTITVSTGGDVAVQVTGAKPSTTFDGFFCQSPSSYLYHTGREGCFALNQSLVTDTSGNAKLTFHFPKSGMWEGAFFFDPNGNTSYNPAQITTDVSDDDPKAAVSAPLLPMSKTNPPNTGDPYIPSSSPQEAGSGTVTVSGAKVTVKFTGGQPNTKYGVGTDFSYGGSAGGEVGTFTTDASGNANVTLPPRTGSGTLITVGKAGAQNEFGVAAAFSVP